MVDSLNPISATAARSNEEIVDRVDHAFRQMAAAVGEIVVHLGEGSCSE